MEYAGIYREDDIDPPGMERQGRYRCIQQTISGRIVFSSGGAYHVLWIVVHDCSLGTDEDEGAIP